MKKAPVSRRARRSPSPWLRLALVLPLSVSALPAEDEPPDAEAAKPGAESAATEGETQSGDSAQPEAAPDLKNWVEVGVGGRFTSGNEAAGQRRTGVPEGAFGGIESFHYEDGFGKDKAGTFKLDGRGIFDNHDYRVSLDFTMPDQWYVRTGYTEFRTWYNGSGGYFPPTDLWLTPYDPELAMDRSQFFIEGGLRLAKLPRLTVRYELNRREGTKDSTSWGASNQTGGQGARSVVPGFLDVDELRHLILADLEHGVGKTTFKVGLRAEFQQNDNTRNLRQYPGEGVSNDRHVTQRDGLDANLFNVHAHVEERLSKKVLLTAGYAYTDLNTDVSGYRVYGSTYDPDLAQRLPSPGTYQSLTGGSLVSQHVGNFNSLISLGSKLALIPSVRVENRNLSGLSDFGQPAAPFSPSSYQGTSERGLLDVSEAVELRYSGLTNWVFYGRGSWLQGTGDLSENLNNRTTATAVLWRSTDDTRESQKYEVGSNWYPLRRLSFGVQYYHKIRDNEFDHTTDSTSNVPGSFSRYPAFLTAQHYDTDDVNFRVTWRPRANLTLVGRYDYQLSSIDSQADALAELQTADLWSQIVSGSVSWIPWPRLFLQAGLSYVNDRTDSPVSDLTPAILDSRNDYWTGHLSAGYVLDDKTDLEVSYFVYRADNYVDNSAYGQPYDSGIEEHGVTAGISRRLSPRTRISLKYGYFTSADETSGGNNDFASNLIYSTFQYRF